MVRGSNKKCDWCHSFLLQTHETTVCDKCQPLVDSGYIRKCEACDSTTTYIKKNGREQWATHDGHRMCAKCWFRYVRCPADNPTSNIKYKESFAERNKRKISFMKKGIVFDFRPRKGVCELCGAKDGDNWITMKGKMSVVTTDIHHMEYHQDAPLKDTVELCDSCHAKETQAQIKMNKLMEGVILI